MSDRRTRLVVFGYSDGSYEYAEGDHATEVMAYLSAAQSMWHAHGAEYKGKKMTYVPAPHAVSDELEPIKPIAERTFPEWVAELSRTHKE